VGIIALFVGAVGLSIGAQTSAAAAQTWSTPTQLTVASTGLGSRLDGVSCWDSGDCLAVGGSSNGYPNGVVYAFGDALNYGSANDDVGGSNPAATIFTTADGGGYWVVSSNGSVITEGNAPYDGGANNLHLNGRIIAGTG
jgi:hypothetical protein